MTHVSCFVYLVSVAASERVLLLFPPGLDFIAAFLGCLYAGAVAVPAYPPAPGRGAGRLRSLLADARPCLALTVSAGLDRVTRQDVDALMAIAFESYFSSLSFLGHPDKCARLLARAWRIFVRQFQGLTTLLLAAAAAAAFAFGEWVEGLAIVAVLALRRRGARGRRSKSAWSTWGAPWPSCRWGSPRSPRGWACSPGAASS